MIGNIILIYDREGLEYKLSEDFRKYGDYHDFEFGTDAYIDKQNSWVEDKITLNYVEFRILKNNFYISNEVYKSIKPSTITEYEVIKHGN